MRFPNRDEPSCSKVKWSFRGVLFIAEVQIDETRAPYPTRQGRYNVGFDPDVVSLQRL
jgi:hypothetical protein